MGKSWQDWREAIKRRISSGPTPQTQAPAPPMSNNVVTLNRPQKAQVAVTVDFAQGVAQQQPPPAAYVDTLARRKPSPVSGEIAISTGDIVQVQEAIPVDPATLPSIEYAPGTEMDEHYKNLTINRKKHAHHATLEGAPANPVSVEVATVTSELASTTISQ